MARYLDTAATRRFYDRFGQKLDSQAFYEDPALSQLVGFGDFSNATSVMEFGCGTGRLAYRLLSEELTAQARYAASDLSKTMVDLAQARLADFKDRISVWQNNATVDFTPGHPAFDRVLCTFVLDLLPPLVIEEFLSEAYQTLAPGGLLCVINLTTGPGAFSFFTSTIWSGIATISPRLVGGCRPIKATKWLEPKLWRIRHHTVKSAWAVPFEITVAERL